MVQILSVVSFFHLQGVIHRDLKPEVGFWQTLIKCWPGRYQCQDALKLNQDWNWIPYLFCCFRYIFVFLSIVLTMLSQCKSFLPPHVCGLIYLCFLFFQNFLFSSKDENSPLKVIDFGLSDFVKPGLSYWAPLGPMCMIYLSRFNLQ